MSCSVRISLLVVIAIVVFLTSGNGQSKKDYEFINAYLKHVVGDNTGGYDNRFFGSKFEFDRFKKMKREIWNVDSSAKINVKKMLYMWFI